MLVLPSPPASPPRVVASVLVPPCSVVDVPVGVVGGGRGAGGRGDGEGRGCGEGVWVV